MRARTCFAGGVLANAAIVLVAIGAATLATRNGSTADFAAVQRMDKYCLLTRAALEMDAADLESGEPTRQADATRRLDGTHSLHDDGAVRLCATIAPDSIEFSTCWRDQDYRCLDRYVRRAIQAIPGGQP